MGTCCYPVFGVQLITGRGFTPASVTRLDGHVVDTRWVSATELAVTLTVVVFKQER
jgi:hypothetical protein